MISTILYKKDSEERDSYQHSQHCKYANFKLHANHLVVHIILIYSEAAFYCQSIARKVEIIENKQITNNLRLYAAK